eukprot:6212141-Pleurochrysis_carterae.AAC.1
MTSIEKLRISGVRSFSPSHPQTIAFQKPLTLIVGKNGSGKTTIIECLKMATTGSLPPHVNGQQFINDPALHSVTETKAQIKLKLTAPRSRGGGRAQGQPMVCVRSFSLTQKNAKKEYKALESALQARVGGHHAPSLSHTRNADLLSHTHSRRGGPSLAHTHTSQRNAAPPLARTHLQRTPPSLSLAHTHALATQPFARTHTHSQRSTARTC